MSTRVYRMSVLWGVRVAAGPVGTNLGLFWLRWALLSGRFWPSRGAVFPALADLGLPADAVRRSGVWALGHPAPRAGVAPGGPAGRPLAYPWLGRFPPGRV